MTKPTEDQVRAERLKRARAFLEAGRTQIETGPAAERSPERADPAGAGEDASRPDPTRYGDWEKNGRCIDF